MLPEILPYKIHTSSSNNNILVTNTKKKWNNKIAVWRVLMIKISEQGWVAYIIDCFVCPLSNYRQHWRFWISWTSIRNDRAMRKSPGCLGTRRPTMRARSPSGSDSSRKFGHCSTNRTRRRRPRYRRSTCNTEMWLINYINNTYLDTFI